MNTAKNITGKTIGFARQSTNVVTGAGKLVTNVTVSATQKIANTTVSATKTVAATTVGTVTGSVGIVGGLASATMNVTKSTAMRMTKMNRRGNKYSGGRRLKRQNSRLAWESRVTAPYIKLDLILECQNLPKKSSFYQSDGFCVVWEVPAGKAGSSNNTHDDTKISKLPARNEREIGRTEVCRECMNPKFITTFRLEYKFQEEQHYIVRVYNEDLQYSNDLKEHDFIGGCCFRLGELMGAGGCSIARPLSVKHNNKNNNEKNKTNNNKQPPDSSTNRKVPTITTTTTSTTTPSAGKPYLILVGQEIIETREVLEFRFSGQDLAETEKKRSKVQMAKDVLDTMQKVNVATVLDKFHLYFRIEKLIVSDDESSNIWKVIWKSEVVKDTQNPTWNSARIPLQSLLTDDNPDTPLKLTLWDWKRFSPDELVGYIETSVNDLTHQSKRGIPVFNVSIEKKRFLRGSQLKKAGIIKVLKAQILQIPSMLQYISGGCQMDLVFAVDCTSGNGHWTDETSQHYHSSTWLNDYQAAIHKIATVYQGFEGNKDYGLWGYGAIIDGKPVQSYVSMGDNLTTSDKLVEAYDNFFSDDNTSLQLGPVGNLKPVIHAAMYRANKKNQFAKQSNIHTYGRNSTSRTGTQQQSYTTLVILTTGEVSDIVDSIDAVCAAAEDAPLSVIIIGVGGTGDFQLIDLLTGAGDEGGKLRHSNGVPIAREVVNFVSFHEFSGNASQVVVEALREVPEQFVQYFLNAGIQPLPPKALPDFTLSGYDSTRNTAPFGAGGAGNDGKGEGSKRGNKSKLLLNGTSQHQSFKKKKTTNNKKKSKNNKTGNADDDVSDLEEDDQL